MVDLPQGFINIVAEASLEQCKSMMMYLNNFINSPTTDVVEDLSDFTEYTGHITNFTTDDQLKNTIIAEVTSLGILGKKQSNKVTTQWLSPDNREYCFSDSQRFKHAPKPISDYPGICKLLNLVNDHPSTTQNLDAALVMCYNKNKTGLNFHHDGEKLIDQNSSLAVISYGSERRMEFCCQGGPKEPQYSVDVCEGDLLVMKPGCQQKLLHRICPGTPAENDNWRFSISFRKVVPDIEDDEVSFTVGGNSNTTISEAPKAKPKISIIVGDSMVTGLDSAKLGRQGKKTVINLSKGGSTVGDVSTELDNFYTTGMSDGSIVEKVFVCVGTNDIRPCKESGVSHLRGKLFKLISKIKLYFPGAKIWFQSLLPLPIQNCWTVQNIELYNKMLYEVCSTSSIFFIDCFNIFLAPTRSGILLREEPLFVNSTNIHPNNRGFALIARKYLFLIHNRRFNPLAY